MRPDEALRFERYCERQGHKKSTLIARLVREHLDREERHAPVVLAGDAR